MPKYYEEKEEDGRACAGVREDLRQCLLETSCVTQVRGRAGPAERPLASYSQCGGLGGPVPVTPG